MKSALLFLTALFLVISINAEEFQPKKTIDRQTQSTKQKKISLEAITIFPVLVGIN
jgi:hypothetical protein